MQQVLLISTLQTLALATAALLLVWLLLRFLDKTSGNDFGKLSRLLRQSPTAAAVYYGARFIGACLLVGLII